LHTGHLKACVHRHEKSRGQHTQSAKASHSVADDPIAASFKIPKNNSKTAPSTYNHTTRPPYRHPIMDGQGSQEQHIDNAVRKMQEKKQIPEIDFTLHTMEDGTQVSTQERVCKGTLQGAVNCFMTRARRRVDIRAERSAN
jgi:hypothetical protein